MSTDDNTAFETPVSTEKVNAASARLSAWMNGESEPAMADVKADLRTVLQSFASLEASLDGARANLADVAELLDLPRTTNGLDVRNAVAKRLSTDLGDRAEVAYVCGALARDLESAGGWPSVSRCKRMAESLRRAERFLNGSRAPEDAPTVPAPAEAAPGREERLAGNVGGIDSAILAEAEDALAATRRSARASASALEVRLDALKAVRSAYPDSEAPNVDEWVKLASWLLTGSTTS